MKKITTRQRLHQDFLRHNPDAKIVSRPELLAFAEEHGYTPGCAVGLMNELPKPSRGHYDVSQGAQLNVVPMITSETVAAPVASVQEKEETVSTDDVVYVPKKDKTYISWGHHSDLLPIVETGMFYPIYITGLSGNGKTMMVEQVCASLGRKFVRVQITPETDEDDLIGGFRLKNGDTVFEKGPVIRAMESGAVLLIDEIDRGSTKLMCLQGILEGKPVLIKKTGETVKPAQGFNIIATANTKGLGDDTGKFISATIIDDAFLERFTIVMEQNFAPSAVEKKILNGHMKKYGVHDGKDFVNLLVKWSEAVRKTYQDDGGIDDVISTRRLCHIVQTFSIFGDRKKAIDLCVARFEDDVRQAMVDLYEKLDVTIHSDTSVGPIGGVHFDPDDNPF